MEKDGAKAKLEVLHRALSNITVIIGIFRVGDLVFAFALALAFAFLLQLDGKVITVW